jgi:hypothetical protein
VRYNEIKELITPVVSEVKVTVIKTPLTNINKKLIRGRNQSEILSSFFIKRDHSTHTGFQSLS